MLLSLNSVLYTIVNFMKFEPIILLKNNFVAGCVLSMLKFSSKIKLGNWYT